jgi:adenylate cyclase
VPSNLSIHETLQLSPLVQIAPAEAILPAQNLCLIPVVLFRYAATLQTLDLSRNLMLTLPSDFMQSCTALTTLRLSDSELDRIPAAVAEAVTLTSLDISVNLLKSAALTPLTALHRLTALNLQANKLTGLPTEFSALVNLTSLNLASNYLTELPPVLATLKRFSILNVSFNYIGDLSAALLSALTCLTELNVACNVLTILPSTFATALPNLLSLDIRGNALTDIRPVAAAPALQRLLLDFNSISELPPLCLPALIDLSLPHNPITQFHIEGAHLPDLRVLCLSNCKLISLPDDLFQICPRIEKLILDDNRLRKVSPSFTKLRPSLSTFSAVNNKLSELPPCIGRFQRLIYLDVRGNNLKAIPADIWFCSSLNVLNVSSNLLTTFPMPPDKILDRIRDKLKEGASEGTDDWYVFLLSISYIITALCPYLISI